MTVTPPPPPLCILLSLEIVKKDGTAGCLWLANAIPPLVVQVVLVDGQEREVGLALEEALSSLEPQQFLPVGVARCVRFLSGCLYAKQMRSSVRCTAC